MQPGTSSAARLITTPPRLCPTSTQPGSWLTRSAMKRAQDSSDASLDGKSGAITRAPCSSSSGISLCQHQAPCQAPATRMKVEFTGADDTAGSVPEHGPRGGERPRGQLFERPGALRLV